MNDYIQLTITVDPCSETVTDLLAAFLADVGYESFVPDSKGLTAFVSKSFFDKDSVDTIIRDFPIETSINYSFEEIEGQDWNEEWEKNYFQPIIIGDKCVIHSTFHKDIPKALYDITIDPKMAFGTGHHATTNQMVSFILKYDLDGKDVIDMGTGTGILAILCCMKGCNSAIGIEIDEFAYTNAIENAELNSTDVKFINGDASSLSSIHPADIFLANINRNVIINDLPLYSKSIKKNGRLFLSGFYEEDIPMIVKAADKEGFSLVEKTSENKWAALCLIKNK